MAGGNPTQHLIPRISANSLQDEESVDVQAFVILGDLIIPIPRDRDTVIGRDNESCDVVIADARVSKMHAAIRFAADRYFVKDLGSLNGTLVNSEKVVDSLPLVSGDMITLPPYKMTFAGEAHPRIVQMQEVRATTPEPSRAGGSHFSGHLNILSITDLIQLLNTTKQSGTLTIRSGVTDSASVSVHTGEILQARYLDLYGEEAVYEILGLAEGEFEFVQGTPPIPSKPVNKPTLTLLLEGCRIMDEASGAFTPVSPSESESGDSTLLFDNAPIHLFENLRAP